MSDFHTYQFIKVEGERLSKDEVESRLNRGEKAFRPEIWQLLLFLRDWFSDEEMLSLHTSGSTGSPKEIIVEKQRMVQSAMMTIQALHLKRNSCALLAMNLRYVGAMMMVVRAIVGEMELIVRPASAHPLKDVEEKVDFAAFVPLQVFESLHMPLERQRLERVGCLIIGGGAIEPSLAAEIRQLPNSVYSTYGMTETLSHIALRRLNGEMASENYHVLEGVQIHLSEENTLVIDAPKLCPKKLVTNDIAQIVGKGEFLILGRKDNVINSGGVKIQIEQVEQELKQWLPMNFAITSVPDARLGETVCLLYEGEIEQSDVMNAVTKLAPYSCPKIMLKVARLPFAGNRKVDRRACREVALLMTRNPKIEKEITKSIEQ